jgi:hypothetical protein
MPQEMAYGELAGFAPVVGMHAAIGALARQCAFCEFTMSDDWFNGIFCDPGGHNAVAGCCHEKVG